MDNIGYLAMSRAVLLQRATDVTANNVANANTTGFRAASPVFESLVVDGGGEGDMREMAYAIDRGTFLDVTEGGLERTSNPLDVALTGSGWFGYLTEDGQTGLGRNGSFTLSAEGDLMTVSGHRVLDAGGAPITIPPGSGAVNIARDGTISDANNEVIARIGVFEAPDASSWAQLGDVMLAPREGPLNLVPALEPAMSQGFVEKSNVNPIGEMTNMISYQRQYESSMNLASTVDELRKTTLSRLAPE